MANNESKFAGFGLAKLLLVAFIVLKLVGEIAWPWIWVLSPLWIPFVLIIGLTLIIWLVKIIFSNNKKKDDWRFE